MKKSPWLEAETYRALDAGLGQYSSRYGDRFGVFFVPFQSYTLKVIVSAGDLDPKYPWDHVSVSLRNRCPSWAEMCRVKELFFDDDEVVMQLHPAKKDHVNCHPYCLHLWKPMNEKIPLPPSIMVGPDEYKGKPDEPR